MKKVNLKILIILLLTLFLYSCSFKNEQYGVNIDKNLRDEIKTLNIEFIESVKVKDVLEVKKMCSVELLGVSENNLEYIINSLNLRNSSDSIEIIAEYYVKSSKLIPNEVMLLSFDYPYKFTLLLPKIKNEMVVNVCTFDNGFYKNALVLSYGKYGNEWKIINFQFGTYSIYNKTAIDWYTESKRQYRYGYLLDASLKLNLAYQCIRPSLEFWCYSIENEIVDYNKSLENKVAESYKLPIELTEIKTKPSILYIEIKYDNNYFYPQIVYKSKFDISDTINIKKENIEIQDIIDEKFIGIDLNNDCIYYKVINKEFVENDTVGQFYEIVQYCKK